MHYINFSIDYIFVRVDCSIREYSSMFQPILILINLICMLECIYVCTYVFMYIIMYVCVYVLQGYDISDWGGLFCVVSTHC